MLAATGAEAPQEQVLDGGQQQDRPAQPCSHNELSTHQQKALPTWRYSIAISTGEINWNTKGLKDFFKSVLQMATEARSTTRVSAGPTSIFQTRLSFFLIESAKKCTKTSLCVISINQPCSSIGRKYTVQNYGLQPSLYYSPRPQLWPTAASLTLSKGNASSTPAPLGLLSLSQMWHCKKLTWMRTQNEMSFFLITENWEQGYTGL